MKAKVKRAYKSESPFDDSAVGRQMRMGLLDADGEVNRDAVEHMARLHAGLLYDKMCDTWDDYGCVVDACGMIIDLAERGEAEHALIMTSIQYDHMRCPLPEAVWWISGSRKLLPPFESAFARCLSELLEEAGSG